jgi:hypothetical protein
MWYVLFVVASLCISEAATRSADLARHLDAVQARSASYDADYARSRGTGESEEDLQPLSRAELEREYRVDECDGLLWVYDRRSGELVLLLPKPSRSP